MSLRIRDLCSRLRRPLETTFDMTTLTFSTGGCPSCPFYSFTRGPWYPVFCENPSREVATKDHSSSNPPKGNPPDLKTNVDVSKVDVKGFPHVAHQQKIYLGDAPDNSLYSAYLAVKSEEELGSPPSLSPRLGRAIHRPIPA